MMSPPEPFVTTCCVSLRCPDCGLMVHSKWIATSMAEADKEARANLIDHYSEQHPTKEIGKYPLTVGN